MEHDEPAEGEVLVLTAGGAFMVKGSLQEVANTLGTEEWAHFDLAEGADHVIVRSAHVVALRGGTRQRRGNIGFHRP